MKRSIKIIFISAFILITTNSFAQSNDYKAVDDYVKKIGPLDTLNVGSISAIVTQPFQDKVNKARAIYDWIAYNIDFDCKNARGNNNDKSSSDDVLKYRKATPTGYANLFQDMCSVVEIRCLTVDGYTKNSPDDINNPEDETNDTWDVIQLGQTSSEWYYVDVARGSGFTDKDFKTFTKAFNGTYFFADKAIFNFQHFPDNIAWQLGGTGPKDKKDFFALPVIKDPAYEFGTTDFEPVAGYIKTKAGKPLHFVIHTNRRVPISVVSIAIGDSKKKLIKQADYSSGGDSISFNYTFDDTDSFPIAILINGKEVLDYMVEVN